MKSFESDHSREDNVCSRCGVIGHYAFEHATGTMEPFGTDRVVYSSVRFEQLIENFSEGVMSVDEVRERLRSDLE